MSGGWRTCWRSSTRPYDPRFPQVCLDEASTQLLTHSRPPQPPQPGRPARQDYEYGRAGVANLFMCYAPLAGRRRVMVRERRTKADWAWCIRELLEEHYPQAERLVLVLDNLNTHTPASLYEVFPPRDTESDRPEDSQPRRRGRRSTHDEQGKLSSALPLYCSRGDT